MKISSVHLNRNLLCSIDIETTGLIPGTHEIVQLAVIPLAPDLTPSKTFKTFELRIKPENTKVIDANYKGMDRELVREALTSGMERWAAVAYFENWFHNILKLGPNKAIVPLGCNYESFDYPFLVDFFGGIECYREFFRGDVRDVQRMALAINDVAEWKSERIPFPKVNLGYLCSCLDIKNERRHDAIYDARATAEAYRRMLNLAQFYLEVPSSDFEKLMDHFASQYGEYCAACVGKSMPVSFQVFKATWEDTFGALR